MNEAKRARYHHQQQQQQQILILIVYIVLSLLTTRIIKNLYIALSVFRYPIALINYPFTLLSKNYKATLSTAYSINYVRRTQQLLLVRIAIHQKLFCQ